METITDTEVYEHPRRVIVELRGDDTQSGPAVRSDRFRKTDDLLRLQSELDDQHQDMIETLLADAGYSVESLNH